MSVLSIPVEDEDEDNTSDGDANEFVPRGADYTSDYDSSSESSLHPPAAKRQRLDSFTQGELVDFAISKQDSDIQICRKWVHVLCLLLSTFA